MSKIEKDKLSEKDKKILDVIVKKLIIRRLKKDNISYNNEEIDEIIKKYNNMLDFIYENSNLKELYRFGFAVVPKSFYDREDFICYDIMKSIINLKNKHLEKYLDYLLILHSSIDIYGTSPLHNLNDYMRQIIKMYNVIGEYFIVEYFDDNRHSIEDTIDNQFDEIKESGCVSTDYKDLIKLIKEIFDLYRYEYYLDDYIDNDLQIPFTEYLNALYFYIVKNDLINTDYDNLYNFISNIYNDIPGTVDKLLLENIDNDDELFDYIDIMYKKSKNKIKIIK